MPAIRAHGALLQVTKIADKIRSYESAPQVPDELRAPCRSGPCPRIARMARSYR